MALPAFHHFQMSAANHFSGTPAPAMRPSAYENMYGTSNLLPANRGKEDAGGVLSDCYMSAFLCECERVCVHACAYVCVRVCARPRASMSAKCCWLRLLIKAEQRAISPDRPPCKQFFFFFYLFFPNCRRTDSVCCVNKRIDISLGIITA